MPVDFLRSGLATDQEKEEVEEDEVAGEVRDLGSVLGWDVPGVSLDVSVGKSTESCWKLKRLVGTTAGD